MLFVCTLNKFY